jgi:transposase-like protein
MRKKRKAAKQVQKDIDLLMLMQQYNSEETCREYLQHLRWPEGVKCPRCQSAKISRISMRNQFDCDNCRYQFSVTAGTIFHDSHLPLWKWFAAAYLVIESKKGISACQIQRTLHVSYKTAWYLNHRIRAAVKDEGAELLKGIVEGDESFVGGKRRHVGSGNMVGKTMVVGALERGGPIRFRVEKRRDRKTLHKFIQDHVADEAEAIYTDELKSYEGIEDYNTRHESVNHSIEEWVRGDVHTNGMESGWSLFKRSIVGAYHHLSEKHLPAYLDEAAFRFNNRKNPHLFRDTLRELLTAEALPYKQLVA